MRVLCSCNPVFGHVSPMLGLAQALRDAGHDVAFMSGTEVSGAVSDAGFRLLPAGPDFGVLVGEALGRYPNTSFATPEDQQRFGFERLFSEIRVEVTIEDATRQAQSFAPDLVVNEVADFVGPLVAAQLGIPNVTFGIGLVVRDEWLRLAAAAVARFWEAAGPDAPADGGLYRWLYLNQLPRTLQRSTLDALPSVHDLRPTVIGDGELLPSDLDHLGRDRPLVYVTFGTVFGDPVPIRTVVDGLLELDVDVLVTVGPDLDPSAVDPSAANVVVRPFVPQGAVLDRCRLVVTHGGVGSVVGPLRYGVPLVVVPMGADQQENGEQVAAVGAGRVIDAAQLDAAAVQTAVVETLADREMARVVAGLREEIAAMPAPADVVPVLESLVR